jgi:hypothetical protein
MKVCPVGAKLFHVDGETDMKKVTVVFRIFANMSIKVKVKEKFTL